MNYISVGDALAAGFYFSIGIILLIELRDIWQERNKNEGNKFKGE